MLSAPCPAAVRVLTYRRSGRTPHHCPQPRGLALGAALQHYPDAIRSGMPGHVGERLLKETIHGDVRGLGQRRDFQALVVDTDLRAPGKVLAKALQGGTEADGIQGGGRRSWAISRMRSMVLSVRPAASRMRLLVESSSGGRS